MKIRVETDTDLATSPSGIGSRKGTVVARKAGVSAEASGPDEDQYHLGWPTTPGGKKDWPGSSVTFSWTQCMMRQ